MSALSPFGTIFCSKVHVGLKLQVFTHPSKSRISSWSSMLTGLTSSMWLNAKYSSYKKNVGYIYWLAYFEKPHITHAWLPVKTHPCWQMIKSEIQQEDKKQHWTELKLKTATTVNHLHAD